MTSLSIKNAGLSSWLLSTVVKSTSNSDKANGENHRYLADRVKRNHNLQSRTWKLVFNLSHKNLITCMKNGGSGIIKAAGSL